MNRSRLNLLLDILSFLIFVALIATGSVMRFVLPPGSGGRGRGRAMVLWGWSRHDWGDVHFWLSVSLVVLVLLHLVLHWRWVCNVIGQMLGRGTSTGGEPAHRASGRIHGIGVPLCIAVVAGGLVAVAQV